MARVATKAADNVWYRARINASGDDERFKSRAGAAEVLGMCETAIAETELETEKMMSPDKADVMICGYRDANLAGHYCKEKCPIGKYVNISSEKADLANSVVHLIADMVDVESVENELLKIAYDDEVSDDEIGRFREISDKLNRLAVSISSIRAIRDSRDLKCARN